MKRLFIILVAAVALGWAGSASAQSCTASANGYTYCQVLAVASGQIPGALTNFPIPFCFNMTEGNGNSCPVNVYLRNVGYPAQIKHTVTFTGQTCPADLNFYSDSAGATPLNWDCAYYSPTSGALEVYVQMSVTTGVNYVYMYFGNAAVTTFQGGAVGAAWDASFQGVLHVSDGTTLNIADSKNVQTPSNSGSTASTGQINGGVAVSSQHIVVKSAKILGGALNFTVHAWIKTGANRGSVYSERGTSGNDILKMDVDTGVCPNLVEFAYRDDAGNLEELCSVTTVTNSAWHQVDIVSIGSPSAMSIYIDGNSDSSFSSTVTNTFTNATLASWAGQDNGDAGANFIGNIDELELSNTNRSANWIKASYNAESVPSTFFSVNTPSPTPPLQFPATLTGQLTGQLISAPLLPQVTPNVTFPPDAGYTHTAVASGANLQTAITGAACGTKLLLAANGSFTAGGTAYTMPNTACACHTDPSKYVIIQSDDPSYTNGSVRGTRIDPSVEYTKLTHITGTDNAGTFAAVTNGDSCYRLGPGLDITNTTGTFEIINIGSQQPTPANFPHDIILDHVYLHAGAAANMQHCAEMSGNFMAVVDSYIADCHFVGGDAQAIFVRDGFGPHLWQNNFLEGATENTMSGAVAAQVTPSDFTIQGNHYFKTLSWRIGDPSYYGIAYPVKNSLEFKLGQRILATGNVFEYTWANGQNEFVILNQGCNAHMGVGNLIQDVNFNLNIFRHGPSTFIYGGCDDSVAYPTLRVYLHDNLWWDIDALLWDGPGAAEKTVLINPGGFGAPRPPFSAWDLWHVHETYSAANMGTGVYFTNGPSFYYGIQIRDSILGCGTFGCFYGASSTTGDSTVSTSAPTANFKNNCLYGTLNTPYNSSNFTGLQNPANLAAIFVNPGSDFHVKPSSLCYQTASDGKSMGADIDSVNAATAGAVQTLGNLHTVTNVSPSTFTHLGSTSITITGTNFISGAAEVIIGGAGPAVAETSNSCGFSSPGQFTVTVSTDTTHFTYTGGCAVVTSAPITLAVNDTINVTVNSAATTGTVNRYADGHLCASLSVVNSTTITCTTPAATGTVTNGPVSVFVSQFGIPVQSTVYGAYN